MSSFLFLKLTILAKVLISIKGADEVQSVFKPSIKTSSMIRCSNNYGVKLLSKFILMGYKILFLNDLFSGARHTISGTHGFTLFEARCYCVTHTTYFSAIILHFEIP